ncbi:MAG: prepilin-type N-terminal cleavage/methylation domain-containing protein [Pirellulaceae bacterium]
MTPVTCHHRATISSSVRSGLTLLEVMIALAILGTSLAALGELIRIGADAADRAVELTEAQFICDSVLAEIKSGVRELVPVAEEPYTISPPGMVASLGTGLDTSMDMDETGWLYTVIFDSVDDQGLMYVEVTVMQDRFDGRKPAMVTLTTWMIDPMLDSEAEPEDLEALEEEMSGTTTDSATGGDTNR